MKKDPERDEFYGIANDCAFDYWKLTKLMRERENASKAESDFIRALCTKHNIYWPQSSSVVLSAIKEKIADAFIGDEK